MQEPMSPAERKMLHVLDRSWLIPGSVKNAIKYEWARGKPGVALAMLALWQLAFYGATTVLLLTLTGH
jgi:hypothetical protein